MAESKLAAKQQTPATPRKSVSHTIANPSADGHGTLFLRNLRLLDLDHLPDWPSITSETFHSLRDARVQQKSRVSDAEWVLFRLVEIWDANEARSSLQRFFPALEPLQSIKFRAALFQYLNTLKHNGVLGRDCALRKSMLDECKGARFEELLSALSTAVLRKVTVIEQERRSRRSIATSLGTADTLTSDEEGLLEPLVLAHQASLGASLRDRSVCRGRIAELETTLKTSERRLQLKTEKLAETAAQCESNLKDEEVDANVLKNLLRHNCVGDQQWLSITISGENTMGRDMMLEDSFSNMWGSIKTGNKHVHPDQPTGWLADLEQRVEQQKSRLASWRDFQNHVSKRNESLIVHRSPSKSPRKSPRKAQQGTPLRRTRKHSRFASESDSPRRSVQLNASLLKHDTPVSSSAQIKLGSSAAERASKELSNVVHTDTVPQANTSKPRDTNAERTRIGSDNGLGPSIGFGNVPTQSPSLLRQRQKQIRPSHGNSHLRGNFVSSGMPDTLRSPVIKPPSSGNGLFPDAAMVDGKKTSVDAPDKCVTKALPISDDEHASESQYKLPTLQERASQTLALQTSSRPQPDSIASPTPTRVPHTSQLPAELDNPSPEPRLCLNERTRQTLALQSGLGRSKSHRRSKSMQTPHQAHAVNPWTASDAPRDHVLDYGAEAEADTPGGLRTPKEELFSEGTDCASVFKTRPKIRTSPVGGSPSPFAGDDAT